MSNKIAIVTGGSRGLGKNAALRLASKGVDVILTYRSQRKEAESVVAEIEKVGAKAVALQLDGEGRCVDDTVAAAVHEGRDSDRRERVAAGHRVAQRVTVGEAVRQRTAVRVDEVDVVGGAAVGEGLHVRREADRRERLGRVDLVARERLGLWRVVRDRAAGGQWVAAHGDGRA